MATQSPPHIAPNQLVLGRHCFIVRARTLPAGFNQRPGVTLLIAHEQPLALEIEGQAPATATNWLLAPEVRRRFVSTQAHTSITIEPAHPAYTRILRWARTSARGWQRFELNRVPPITHALASQAAFDDWLTHLLDQHQQPPAPPNPRLDYLLALVAAGTSEGTDSEGTDSEGTSAEHIWRQFRLRYPGTQAHCSHWLQDCLGIPLRKLILWNKLRFAMDSLNAARPATEVAHAAGFADSAHLSRICLRTFGMRPSQANNHKILQVSQLGSTDTISL